MLCANRAAVRLCEVLWHSPSVEPFSKSLNNRSVQRVTRQCNAYPILPCFAPGAEILGQCAQPNNCHTLMQWCSFSQSRIFSNWSETKEDMSKRAHEVKGDEMREKRFRLDDSETGGLDEFCMPTYEWQQFDMSSEMRSRREFVPIYPVESLGILSGEEEGCAVERSESEGVPLDGMTVVARKELLLKKVQKLRTWESTDFCENWSQTPDAGVEFTLMSYNILAQDLLENNFYLYGHCDNNVLDWEFRSQNLLAEIETAQPDILCLQELTQTHYEQYFYPRLASLGWNSLYKKRTGGKRDGCAIFFKKSLFELDSYVSVEYFKPHIKHLDRDNVGLIVVLKPLGKEACKAGAKLCVATTHLLFNPRRGDIKLSQLQLLLAEMDKVAFKGQGSNGTPIYHPAILCGDMNSEPYSPLYQFLTSGELMYDGLMTGDVSGQKEGTNRGKPIGRMDLHFPQLGVSPDCQYTHVNAARMGHRPKLAPFGPSVFGNSPMSNPFDTHHGSYRDQSSSVIEPGCLRHKFNLVSAYKHLTHTGEVSVTTHHKKASCIVDYIFYSVENVHKQKPGIFKEGPLHLMGTCRLPTSQEVADLGGLPNAALSSDHLSLIAKFFLSLSSNKS